MCNLSPLFYSCFFLASLYSWLDDLQVVIAAILSLFVQGFVEIILLPGTFIDNVKGDCFGKNNMKWWRHLQPEQTFINKAFKGLLYFEILPAK